MAPVRTCVGCRRTASAEELVRIAVGPDGTIVPGHRSPGRGAWLHGGTATCFEEAVRRKAFNRALRTDVRPPAVESLRRALRKGGKIGSSSD